MPELRKRPAMIEAFALGTEPLPNWFVEAMGRNQVVVASLYPEGHARHRQHAGRGEDHAKGDMIVRGIVGEIYPCTRVGRSATSTT